MMKKLVNLIPSISLAVALLASHPVAASAADPGPHAEGRHPSVVGTIHGEGTANMTDLSPMGVTTFGIHVTLFSDGTARGKFNCVDLEPFAWRGKVFGDITNWSLNRDGTVNLIIPDGTVVPIKSGDQFPPLLHVPFTVKIQHFGGKGVGHWTLDAPDPTTGSPVTICFELLTRGHIVGKGEVFRLRDEE